MHEFQVGERYLLIHEASHRTGDVRGVERTLFRIRITKLEVNVNYVVEEVLQVENPPPWNPNGGTRVGLTGGFTAEYGRELLKTGKMQGPMLG